MTDFGQLKGEALHAAADHIGTSAEWLDEEQKRSVRRNEIAADIAIAHPDLPVMTTIVMSSDLESAERAMARFRAGDPPNPVEFGSYARMSGIVALEAEGLISRDTLLDWWPEHWSSADPDDTDPRLIAIWREAWERNGRRTIYDREERLPEVETLTLYRGQRHGDKPGCAWSLSRDVAQKFANGASYRVSIPDGEIRTAYVAPREVIAYLTDRGEQEVIIDPAILIDTSPRSGHGFTALRNHGLIR
jgi:hypothetical protein